MALAHFGTLRVAARALARSPSTALLAVAALALGIGGTVTVFSAVNAAFLRALPYPDADRLVAVWQASPRSSEVAVAYPVLQDWAADLDEIEGLAGYSSPDTMNLSPDGGRDAARVTSMSSVTEAFFRTLGVSPVVGRTFGPEEARPGAPVVAVISHRLWQGMYGGDPAILSRVLSIEGASVPIIGVMPARMTFPADTDVWVSAELNADFLWSRTAHNFRVIARRRPGVTNGVLAAALTRLNERLERAHPEQREDLGVRVVPIRAQLLGESSAVLWLLFGSVALVLVIACANVANLLLARATGRETESALRRALGADRRAVIAPVVAEALIISAAGAALGVGLAYWAQHVLTAVIPPTVVRPDDIRLDTTVLGFAVLLATATGLASSVLPALGATHVDLRHVLAAGSRSVAGGSHRAMRIFVGVQVALACVLLASAALFGRGLVRLEQIEPGFRADDVAYASFVIGGTPGSRYAEPAARAAFYRSLIDRVDSIPGVLASGVTADLPFAGGSNGSFEIEGVPEQGRASLYFRLVGGRFFETLAIPLSRGRLFDAGDVADRPPVAIVNERAARTYWPDRSPIGTRLRMPGMDGNPTWYTIVGVVADVRYAGLTREPLAEVYFPFEQRPERTGRMSLVAHVTGGAASYAATIGAVVHTLDPGMPASVLPLDRLVDAAVEPSRFRTALVSAFGLTAVMLSMVGIFGVISHVVARRTREMGLRMALGAGRGSVRRTIVARALTPVAAGLAAGTVLTLAGARVAQSMLPGLAAGDLVAVAGAVIVLGAAAVAAAWWPAWRASTLDPMIALRDD